MNDERQNLEIESKAKLAALGGGYDWRSTPISETAGAIATDLYRAVGGRLRDGWWSRAEPRDSSGREIIRLLDRAANASARRGQSPK